MHHERPRARCYGDRYPWSLYTSLPIRLNDNDNGRWRRF